MKPNQMEEQEILELEKPLKFKHVMETEVLTSYELSTMVNSLFSIYEDYEGSVINKDMNNYLTVDLHFRPKGGEEVIASGQPSGQGQRMSNAARVSLFKERNRNRTMTLSESVKKTLSSFFDGGMQNKINWNQKAIEIAETNPMNTGQTIYIKVRDLSIHKIIRAIYGNYDDDGERVEYSVNAIRPITQYDMPGATYLISIMRVHNAEVEKLGRTVGLNPSAASIPMVRDLY